MRNSISWHAFEDSFASCLQAVNNPKFSDFIKLEFFFKILNELQVSRFSILSLKKYTQRIHPLDNMLAWLHWIFDLIE
jgi:hypothetical protein